MLRPWRNRSATGPRMGIGRLMAVLAVGVPLLGLTPSPASAAPKHWAATSVGCTFVASVKFAPPITDSGGGSHQSRMSASLSGCTEGGAAYTLSLAQVTDGHFRGFFAHSPLRCATLSAPGAPITGIATWRGFYDHVPTSFRPSHVVNNSVGANGKGSFVGAASVSLNIPPTLASACASRRGLKSATVTGTITMGPPCGPGGGPIAIYRIGTGPNCGGVYDPSAIVSGSDGALWFVNNGSIGRMTTSGAVTLYSGRDDSATSITAGPDGALWFTSDISDAIGRIATSGTVTVYPTNGRVADITAGPDGALWFFGSSPPASGGASYVGRITTAGLITTHVIPSFAGSDSNLIVGPDGNLWFAHANYNPATGFIGRITTTGVVTTYPDPSGGNPDDITVGPDGALWFIDAYYPSGNSAIGRITTAGVFTNFYSGPNIDPISGIDGGIAAGSDGAVWFTEGIPYSPSSLPNEIGSIGRITTAGVVTTYTAPGVYDPTSITAGPDGALWFTNFGSDTIGRVTTP